MPNIFKQAQQVNDHPKRNNFDLSKKINASFKFGTLYPVYCQPVVPGDSFSIDTAFNIKAMPVVFPVQTKMRAHMHYFYVRNKNLWKNWENWLSNLPNATQDLTPHPFVSRPDSEFTNGSIHDFLGVPTSAVVGEQINVLQHFVALDFFGDNYYPVFSQFVLAAGGDVLNLSLHNTVAEDDVCGYVPVNLDVVPVRDSDNYITFALEDDFEGETEMITTFQVFKSFNSCSVAFTKGESFETSKCFMVIPYQGVSVESPRFKVKLSDINYGALTNAIRSGENVYMSLMYRKYTSGDFSWPSYSVPVEESDFGLVVDAFPASFYEYPDLNIPLYSEHLHINALPYRAYESIYNAYYRNTVVDPLKVNDQVLYNKYIPDDGDGADSYHYELHQRNYELDFLTSALPSPQQGVAPMVGVTALGDITIEDENGITTAHTETDQAGFVTKVSLTSPAASNEHARLLMNIAASGFNINDFRNTNALQRFLETSIRKGYKYKDFIAGHFGVEPKYVELDMPEFVGGFTRDVAVSTVVSNADTLGDGSGAALGEYGGFAQVVGGSRHSVRHYCDDYGFIMGILCITPTPCYSQLLPKHMIAPDNFLDYYFAEFSNIGMQPITYKEVAPIQSYLDGLLDSNKRLEDTFGYQRPNYDMVAAVDEVHGDFRGSLRNYVINRIFDHRPELGHDFIAVRPNEVNDIFVDTDPRDDTFIGEIGFSVHAKRPVPRVVIPNLGR